MRSRQRTRRRLRVEQALGLRLCRNEKFSCAIEIRGSRSRKHISIKAVDADLKVTVTNTAVPDETQLTPAQSGMLSALDFWMYAAEAVYWAATRRNDPNMEAASKAQEELLKIEEQIQQLQGVAGDNQAALKQLAQSGDEKTAKRRDDIPG